MKKLIITFALLLVSIFGFSSITSAATYQTYKNLQYEIFTADNGKQEVRILGSSTPKNLIIPETIAGYPVTEIADNAFAIDIEWFNFDAPDYEEKIVHTVSFPNTLKRIGNGAFMYNSLQNVTLPVGLEEIGTEAFMGNSISSLTVPDSVTAIGASIVGTLYDQRNVEVLLPDHLQSNHDHQYENLYYAISEYNGQQEIKITALM